MTMKTRQPQSVWFCRSFRSTGEFAGRRSSGRRGVAAASAAPANGLPFPNPTGFASTFSTAGRIDLTNEFFQDLGANGRRCVNWSETFF